MSSLVTPTSDAPSCPECASASAAGDQFCEACGRAIGHADLTGAVTPRDGSTQLAAPPRVKHTELWNPSATTITRPCDACGAVVAADGYCAECGTRAESERDHWEEQPSDWFGGVCDRGIRHARNEDAMSMIGATTRSLTSAEGSTFAALVVCDGVSNTPKSDVVSLAAARAAIAALGAPPAKLDSVSARISAWTRRLLEATTAAQAAAVSASADADAANPPSCTFVAAVADGSLLVTAWIGDSRAYWLPDVGIAVQLTIDHSWATEQIRMGVPRSVAEADDRCHAITRWLGVDAPELEPECTSLVVMDQPGWLAVVSDGIWNYCSDATALRDLVATISSSKEPVVRAGALVQWANAQGGHDNLTVVLARLTAPHET